MADAPKLLGGFVLVGATDPDDRVLVGGDECQTPTPSRAERAANLFDLRRIIGGVFVAWGVLLMILGLTDSDAEIDKAAGININLYAGLGMLVVGLVFLLWAFTRPLGEELREAEDGSEEPRARSARGRRARAPAGRATPGGSSASTEPPKPPPTIRAPAAPAAFSALTVASTSGTDAS